MCAFRFSVRREGEADGTRVTVFAPDGSVAAQGDSPDALEIKNPQLWWPRGYGEQPLYTVRVELLFGGAVEDVWERRIGLRTMTVHREKDEWGESFAHEVNGVRVFAMGADYIPEDCLLPQITPETTRAACSSSAWRPTTTPCASGAAAFIRTIGSLICATSSACWSGRI